MSSTYVNVVLTNHLFFLLSLVMHISLRELQRALKGLVVLSADLEAMGNACFDQRCVYCMYLSVKLNSL